MKRRAFLTSVLAGGMAAAPLAAGGQHEHQALDGPLANATVSFGARPADPAAPFDRMTQPPPPPPPPNHHAMVPGSVTVKAGGTVNFIISGLHQMQVYAPGTTPGDVLAAALAGGTISVPGVMPPVVDVSDGRRHAAFLGLRRQTRERRAPGGVTRKTDTSRQMPKRRVSASATRPAAPAAGRRAWLARLV